jgi:hypothetical protein
MITEILYNLNPVMFDAIIDANNDNALLKVKESTDTDSDANFDEDTPINTRLRFRVPQNDLILY